MQQVLRYAAPPGVNVGALSVSDAIKTCEGITEREHVMLLLKTPEMAQQLYAGIHYSNLNIGGIGNRPGRKNVFKNIAMSPEEIAILKDLTEKGVKITLLTVPGEKSKAFTELI